jgi:hypothetical protein
VVGGEGGGVGKQHVQAVSVGVLFWKSHMSDNLKQYR